MSMMLDSIKKDPRSGLDQGSLFLFSEQFHSSEKFFF